MTQEVIQNPINAATCFVPKTHEGKGRLNGKATVRTEGETFTNDRYDALYVPRDSEIEVATTTECDLAEISAPVGWMGR